MVLGGQGCKALGWAVWSTASWDGVGRDGSRAAQASTLCETLAAHAITLHGLNAVASQVHEIVGLLRQTDVSHSLVDCAFFLSPFHLLLPPGERDRGPAA